MLNAAIDAPPHIELHGCFFGDRIENGNEAKKKLREHSGHSSAEKTAVFGIEDLITFADGVF